MSAIDYNDLKRHIGHEIVCVGYGVGAFDRNDRDNPVNVAIECETCCEVLMDYDKPEEKYVKTKKTNKRKEGVL